MSEVDRLSNSGLYPALPIADKQSEKQGPGGKGKSRDDPSAGNAGPAVDADNRSRRPPKSQIDEYA